MTTNMSIEEAQGRLAEIIASLSPDDEVIIMDNQQPVATPGNLIRSCKDIIVTTPDEIARRGHIVGTVLRSALREGQVLYERR